MSDFLNFQCWNSEQLGEIFPVQAHEQEGHLFAAVHAPIDGIVVEKSTRRGVTRSDSDLIAQTANSSDRHKFVVIKGAPGTGKSHLIRWMHQEWSRINPDDHAIFIPRRDSTLRATLARLIESLDEEFADLATSLRNVSSSLNERGIADALVDKLAQLLDVKGLHESYDGAEIIDGSRFVLFLRSWRVRPVLTNAGGVISRIVNKLVGSNVEEINDDYNIEEFSEEDLIQIFNESKDKIDNIVKNRLEKYINNDKDLRKLVSTINQRLKIAEQQILGLAPTDLSDILFELRQRIFPRRLVLLIEDVSCFQGIDDQLIEALAEPGEAGQKIGSLYSVVGITDQYFTDQIEPKGNMVQRITDIFNLSTPDSEAQCSVVLDEAAKVDRFVARYLNAARVDEPKLRSWADNSDRAPDERPPVACKTCKHEILCHSAFGAVDGIGLYPLNRRLIGIAMNALVEPGSEAKALVTTPRSLAGFMRSLLGDMSGSQSTSSPRTEIFNELLDLDHVPALDVGNSAAIKNISGENAQNVSTLVRFYGEASASFTQKGEEIFMGGVPKSVFQAFGIPFPDQGITEAPPAPATPEGPTVTTPLRPPEEPPPTPVRSATARLQNQIDNWLAGEPLERDEEIRKKVASFTKSFGDWQKHGIPPFLVSYFHERRIEIIGQRTSISSPLLSLPRDEETANALKTLVQFDENVATQSLLVQARLLVAFGNKCSEEVAKNLRNLLPSTRGESWNPVSSAYALLALENISNGRAVNSEKSDEFLNRSFEASNEISIDDARPEQWKEFAKFLRDRRGEFQSIIIEAFPREQGDRTNFFDSSSLIEVMSKLELEDDITLLGEPPEQLKGMSDSSPVGKLRSSLSAAYSRLDKALAAERSVSKNLIETASKEEVFGLGPMDLVEKIQRLIGSFRNAYPNALAAQIARWEQAKTNSHEIWGGSNAWTSDYQAQILEEQRLIAARPNGFKEFIWLANQNSSELLAFKNLLEAAIELIQEVTPYTQDIQFGEDEQSKSEDLVKKIKDLALKISKSCDKIVGDSKS